MLTKNMFVFRFLLITFGTFTLKNRVIKKSQNSRNQGFSHFFHLMMEGSGSVQIITDPDPGGPKPKKHKDPDPQHWPKVGILSANSLDFLC
jgi:hypothetical protein